MEYKEDKTNAIYQEGVAARKAGTVRCPYEPGSSKAYYWTRGYADAANPVPDGVMRTATHFVKRSDQLTPSQQYAGMVVHEPGGAVLMQMIFLHGKEVLLSPSEVDAFGEHVQRLLEEHPFEMQTRHIFRGKEFLAARFSTPNDTPGGAPRSSRAARVVDGVVRVPAGAALDANGEIVVPSRQLDSSSPTAKSFRRACRAARNAIRELAEKESRPVSVITKEMMEKSA